MRGAATMPLWAPLYPESVTDTQRAAVPPGAAAVYTSMAFSSPNKLQEQTVSGAKNTMFHSDLLSLFEPWMDAPLNVGERSWPGSPLYRLPLTSVWEVCWLLAAHYWRLLGRLSNVSPTSISGVWAEEVEDALSPLNWLPRKIPLFLGSY